MFLFDENTNRLLKIDGIITLKTDFSIQGGKNGVHSENLG